MKMNSSFSDLFMRLATALKITLPCMSALFISAAVQGADQLSNNPGVIRPTAVRGTQLIVTKADGTEARLSELIGAIVVGVGPKGSSEQFKIAAIEKDSNDPDGDVFLYTFLYQDHQTGEWKNACLPDAKGISKGFPIAGSWDSHGNHIQSKSFTISCTGGAFAKCVRFGYKPWGTSKGGVKLLDYYQACVRMVRADYCGNGQGHTRDGTLIDIFDRLGILREEKDLNLEFEAAWAPDGAVCVAKTRISSWTLDQILMECPERLKGLIGDPKHCNVEQSIKINKALLFNKS